MERSQMVTNPKLNKHYQKGTLDPGSTVGRGTIIEYVVMETMKDCTKTKFDFKYDLDSEDLGEVNVKSSRLTTSNSWNFKTEHLEYMPDYYVCVALNELFTKILHIWIIPPEIILTKRLIIKNSENGISKVKDYEIDSSKYNHALQHINITQYPEFRNIPNDKIDFLCKPIAKTSKYKKAHSCEKPEKKVIGCRTIASGQVRKCKECLRAPHLSKSCTERIWYYTQVGPLMDQYFYEEVFE
ncbi:MAG: hypothetical protein WCX48_09490 [Bacteroidales bacterium]